MSKPTYLRVSILIAAVLAASGCSVFKKGKGPSTPVLGERIAVLTGEGDVKVDPETAALPMSLPQATVNSDWTQSGGNSTKSMGQLALGNALNRAFQVQAGKGSTLTARLAAAPIIAGGSVTAMAESLSKQAEAFSQWSGLNQLGSTITRMTKNLTA